MNNCRDYGKERSRRPVGNRNDRAGPEEQDRCGPPRRPRIGGGGWRAGHGYVQRHHRKRSGIRASLLWFSIYVDPCDRPLGSAAGGVTDSNLRSDKQPALSQGSNGSSRTQSLVNPRQCRDWRGGSGASNVAARDLGPPRGMSIALRGNRLDHCIRGTFTPHARPASNQQAQRGEIST